MKKKIFVANWKEHKTTHEALEWLNEFATFDLSNLANDKQIILCPSFGLLHLVKTEVERLNLPIKIGSQDFPSFDEGPYTGEESPHLLKEFIAYSIIGHSERREHFRETNEELLRKVTLAKEFGIEPIFCIQNELTDIPLSVTLLAYEPPSAIGTGQADTPENAIRVAESVKERVIDAVLLYGGSVSRENVTSFISHDALSGVLIGSSSLNPQSFYQIVSK